MAVGQSLSVAQEIEQIRRGVDDIFPEEELAPKLERARRGGRPLRVKLGIDPTAQDLHLGHIIPVLKLRQFQNLGHQAVLIIGDYTAMVGDPSGRNKARPQLTHAEVMENARTYLQQLYRILDADRTEVVHNGDWFAKMDFAQVTRLLSQMTVARMLEREDFAQRYAAQTPISLHEMLYPLMQGYDSAMIRADIELGGTDQKFNILVGRDIQRDMGQEPQIGVCNPILIGTDGHEKMGKSLGNYIALNDTPEDMYGKTMSIPDDLMPMYFELVTTVSLTEVAGLTESVQSGKLHPMEAKARLAREVVLRFHDEAAADRAAQQFRSVVQEKELPEDIPVVSLAKGDLDAGRIWIPRLLVQAGLAGSNGEARRLIQQGGVRLDGDVVSDANAEWLVRDGTVLQVGKRRFARVILGD